ncbi:MAG: hypothetical protein C4520_13485, partial [Candidatus Abyssobacteria bacterium SURF_5]
MIVNHKVAKKSNRKRLCQRVGEAALLKEGEEKKKSVQQRSNSRIRRIDTGLGIGVASLLLIALQNPLFLSNTCTPLWENLLEIRLSSERMKNLFKGYGGAGIVSLLYLISYSNEAVKRYYRSERPQAV